VRRAAEQLRHADQPGDPARDEHRQQHRALGVHTARHRCRRVEPGRLELEAEPAAADQHPVPDAHQHRDHHEPAEAGALRHLHAERPQQWVQRRELRAPGQRRGCAVVAADHFFLQVLGQQVRGEPGRDDVEHDRGDHLADPAGHLEDASDPGPRRAHRDRDDQHQGDVQYRREVDGGPCCRRQQGRELVLTLHADVEQRRPEADRHRDPGQVQRHRVVHGDQQRTGLCARVQHRPVDLQRVVAAGREHGGTDQ